MSGSGSGSGSGGGVGGLHRTPKKATLCKWFAAGQCKTGMACPYAHPIAEVAANDPAITYTPTPPAKQTVCKYDQSATGCRDGAQCRFLHLTAHSVTPQKKSATACKYWVEMKWCRDGDKCSFLHSPQQTTATPATPATPAAATPKWICSSCTFVNASALALCEVCGYARPQATPPVRTSGTGAFATPQPIAASPTPYANADSKSVAPTAPAAPPQSNQPQLRHTCGWFVSGKCVRGIKCRFYHPTAAEITAHSVANKPQVPPPLKKLTAIPVTPSYYLSDSGLKLCDERAYRGAGVCAYRFIPATVDTGSGGSGSGSGSGGSGGELQILMGYEARGYNGVVLNFLGGARDNSDPTPAHAAAREFWEESGSFLSPALKELIPNHKPARVIWSPAGYFALQLFPTEAATVSADPAAAAPAPAPLPKPPAQVPDASAPPLPPTADVKSASHTLSDSSKPVIGFDTIAAVYNASSRSQRGQHSEMITLHWVNLSALEALFPATKSPTKSVVASSHISATAAGDSKTAPPAPFDPVQPVADESAALPTHWGVNRRAYNPRRSYTVKCVDETEPVVFGYASTLLATLLLDVLCDIRNTYRTGTASKGSAAPLTNKL